MPGKDGYAAGAEGARFQVSPDTVYNTLGDKSVLVHMRTNKIYELNSTGARFWELLGEGHERAEIRQLMLREFDVAEADLDREIEDLLTALEKEGLITKIS
jgi:hypothetical protein